MQNKVLYFLLLLLHFSGLLWANNLFSTYKNMMSKGENDIQVHHEIPQTKVEKKPEKEKKDSITHKKNNKQSIVDDIKQVMSMKKDTFESTEDFRKKRKIKLDLLQAQWKKCMDSGEVCYHAGMAKLSSYDADKELAYFDLNWLKSVIKVLPKAKTLKKVHADIPRTKARKLFSKKKTHPFFIDLKYENDELLIDKMVVGGQYVLKNNETTGHTGSVKLPMGLSAFLHSYVNAGNSSYSPGAATRYYALFVHPYFGIRNATRQDILRDKRKYYRKWPDRNYQLTKYTVIDRYQRAGLSYLEVILEIDWRVASRKRGERTGHSVVSMTLVEDGDSYKITAVRNARIQRDIPVRTSTIRYSPDGSESAETYAPVYFSSNGIKGKMECRRIESYTTCTVTATNHVGTGKGGISISFPNIYYRSSDITLQSSRGFNGDVKFYSQGSLLWSTEYGRKINSSYLLLEGWAKRWRRGETKRIRFSLGAVSTPVQVRAVVVRHRREYIAPADYRTTDQQGYPVAVWHHR